MAKAESWFVVRLIVEIVVPDIPPEERTYEDRFVLVKASTEEEARHKAEAFAQNEETSYLNADEELVQWKLDEIIDVYQVLADEVTDGTELYSTFINFELLQVLKSPKEGPWPAYREAHPHADPAKVTVREILEWYVENQEYGSRGRRRISPGSMGKQDRQSEPPPS